MKETSPAPVPDRCRPSHRGKVKRGRQLPTNCLAGIGAIHSLGWFMLRQNQAVIGWFYGTGSEVMLLSGSFHRSN